MRTTAVKAEVRADLVLRIDFMGAQLQLSRAELLRQALYDWLGRHENLLVERWAAAANRLPPERQAT